MAVLKWLLLVALAGLVSVPAAFAAPGQGITTIPTVYIQNASSVLTDAEILDALPAFQAAVSEDFAPYWSDAHLEFGAGPDKKAWRLLVLDDADIPGALGYHDVKNGKPIGYVFAATTEYAGESWQIVLTHELFEMLGDPYVNRGVVVGSQMYVVETADPVEAEDYAYTRPSATGKPVLISDFVFENWFRPHSAWPYDFTHATKRALQVLSGGYQLVWVDGTLHELKPKQRSASTPQPSAVAPAAPASSPSPPSPRLHSRSRPA